MELEGKPVNNRQRSDILGTLWVYLKILFLIGINIVVFLPIEHYFAWGIFGLEVILAAFMRLNLSKSVPIIKFLLIGLIPMYLLLYFVEYNWLQALVYFSEYSSKILVLLISILIFSHLTPLNTLVESLAKIGIPKRFSFIIVTVLLLIPTISAEVRHVVQHQKARGYRVNIFKLKPILVPVILHLLDLSMKLGLSLESRGYYL